MFGSTFRFVGQVLCRRGEVGREESGVREGELKAGVVLVESQFSEPGHKNTVRPKEITISVSGGIKNER
jgi:hypothetical protein